MAIPTTTPAILTWTLNWTAIPGTTEIIYFRRGGIGHAIKVRSEKQEARSEKAGIKNVAWSEKSRRVG